MFAIHFGSYNFSQIPFKNRIKLCYFYIYNSFCVRFLFHFRVYLKILEYDNKKSKKRKKKNVELFTLNTKY